MALVVDVWVFMVLPTVFALTKSILPISQGELPIDMPHHRPLAGCLTPRLPQKLLPVSTQRAFVPSCSSRLRT